MHKSLEECSQQWCHSWTRPCSASKNPLPTPGGPWTTVWEPLEQPVLPLHLLFSSDFSLGWRGRSRLGGSALLPCWCLLFARVAALCVERDTVWARGLSIGLHARPLGERGNFSPKTRLNGEDFWCSVADCCSETLGHMAVKVPLGSRCAQRSVSFWASASQDAGPGLRAPPSCGLGSPFPF